MLFVIKVGLHLKAEQVYYIPVTISISTVRMLNASVQRHEKTYFLICENKKVQISCYTNQADQGLYFSLNLILMMIDSILLFLNPKFQESS